MACGQEAVSSTRSRARSARPWDQPGPGMRIPGPYRARFVCEQVLRASAHSFHTPTTFYWFSLREQEQPCLARLRRPTRCWPPNHLDSLRRAHLLPQGRPSPRPPGGRSWRLATLERADPVGRPDRRAVGRDAGRARRHRHGALCPGQAPGGRARAGPRRRAGTAAARHRAPPAGAAGRARLRRRARAADARMRRQPLLAAHLRSR